MTTKLNRAKQKMRSWQREYRNLMACVKTVRKSWYAYCEGRMGGDEFTDNVATIFQFDPPKPKRRREPLATYCEHGWDTRLSCGKCLEQRGPSFTSSDLPSNPQIRGK